MTALALCEQGEELLEQNQVAQAKDVLEEAWSHVVPCIDSADFCGYGKRCDRYCARIRAALARCEVLSSSAAGAAVPDQVLQEMRSALPDDGLNPDAHLDLAQVLINTMSEDFRKSEENWLDERYMEAHLHASIACALKRGNMFPSQQGRGDDPPGAMPESVKKLFDDLGDPGGWKRVIFCTGKDFGCSWLQADAAAALLTSPSTTRKEFARFKKKATFVLLPGTYELSLSMVDSTVDLYGIMDRNKRAKIVVPSGGGSFLQAEGASRLRLCSLGITSSSDSPLFLLSGGSRVAVTSTDLTQTRVTAVDVVGPGTLMKLHKCQFSSGSLVMREGATCHIGTTSANITFGPQRMSSAGGQEEPDQLLAGLPTEWKSLGGQRARDPRWQKTFVAAVRHAVRAAQLFDATGTLSSFMGDQVKLCATDEDLELALCTDEGISGGIIVLTRSGLAVSRPVCVKNAVVSRFPGDASSPIQMKITAKLDDGNICLDDSTGTMEFYRQGHLVGSLTTCDVEISIVAQKALAFLPAWMQILGLFSGAMQTPP